MESRSHIKELFSQTVIYGLGIMLNKSVGFLLLPLYTKYYLPEEIGLFTLVQSLSLVLGVIYMFGMETSFMKYFIDSKDDKSRSVIYSSTLALLSVTSLIFSAAVYLNAGSIASLLNFTGREESLLLIKVLSLLMLVDTVYRFPLLFFRAKLESKTYAYINFLTFIVNIICNILFIVVLKLGVESIFYSYIISVGVTFILGLLLTKKYLTLNISFVKIKEMLAFGNKFIFIGFFVLFIDVSDRFFLKYFFDESLVGIYSANYRLASVMSFLIASFKFSWTPYFLNLKSNPENKKIISSIFTNFIFTGLFLFLVFSVFTEQLVKISFFGIEFLDADYWSGLKIIPVILAAYFFSGAYSTLNAAPFFTDNTQAIFYITLTGLIVNTLFNLILIPLYDIMGAAISTFLTYFIMFIIIYFYSQKIYKIEYDWGRIFKMVFLTAVFFAVSYFGINRSGMSTALIIFSDIFLIIIYLAVLNALSIIDLKKIIQFRNK